MRVTQQALLHPQPTGLNAQEKAKPTGAKGQLGTLVNLSLVGHKTRWQLLELGPCPV